MPQRSDAAAAQQGGSITEVDAVEVRLSVYHAFLHSAALFVLSLIHISAPLIDWDKNEKKYQHINGLGTMEGIFAEICEAVDKLEYRLAI